MKNQVASTDVCRWLCKDVNIKKAYRFKRIIGCKLNGGVNGYGKLMVNADGGVSIFARDKLLIYPMIIH